MKKLLLLVTFAMLVSCKKDAVITDVKKDMTLEQVTEILGKPDNEQSIQLFGVSLKMMYYNGKGVVYLNNLSNKVTRVMTPEEADKSFNELGKVFEKK